METNVSAKKYSASDIDIDQEYVYHSYPYLHKENSPVYGVESPDEIVIRPLYFDELCYVLHAEGTHLVLFGGPWSRKTQSVIDRVNYFARKYGVDTVYAYDFRTDGETEDTSIKVDITAQESYDGPDKGKSLGCAECNYIYGELVTRHLTNLNDWVKGKVGSGDDITYLNLYQDAVTVPNLHEPFLFLINKDNKVDNSGVVRDSGYVNERGTYPIISAIELEGYRDETDGSLYSSEEVHNEDTLIRDFDERLEQAIFQYIGEEGVTPYTHADYMYDAFKRNERGHAFKTEDAFQKGEQINIQPINLPELRWLFEQEGSFILLFAGAWCANSQGGVPTINDYAVANNVKVFMIDIRLDGKHPIDFWKYPRLNELRFSLPALRKYNFEIWEKYLPGAPLLCSIHPDRKSSVTTSYTDEDGTVHTILPVDAPYLVAFNKDVKGGRGEPKPVLAACNHEGIELINCARSFVYHEPNYRRYKSGVYSVFYAYCESLGIPVKDITIDRTAPLVEGEPVRHKETVAYHKEHDWYKERAGRAAAGEADGCC